MFALAVVAVITSSLPNLELGARAPTGSVSTGGKLVVSPAQMQDEWTWEYQGIVYSLGVDGDGLVQYISTSSPAVVTPEGAHVGESLGELVANQRVEVKLWPGWGYVADLPSGWKAAMFLQAQFLNREPNQSDRVDLLFKGTMSGYGSGHPPEADAREDK